MPRPLKDTTKHKHLWVVDIKVPIGAKGIGLSVTVSAKGRKEAIQLALDEFGEPECPNLLISASRVT
jgi:hypothetical protein